MDRNRARADCRRQLPFAAKLRAIVSVLVAGLFSLEPGTVSAEPRAECQRTLLQRLGWQFESTSGSTLEIEPGHPCVRGSLAEARRAGDLTVRLPKSGEAAAIAAALTDLAHHPASRCAFSLHLGKAARRAVDRLVSNPGFRFSALQSGWIGFGVGGARADGWEEIRSFGRGFRPLAQPSQAIEGFYRGRIRAECGVGRQVAQYASLRELFGDDGFDSAFGRDEIVIGTFTELRTTRSVLLGSNAGEFVRDGRARVASAAGRQAFAGLPGFIFHVLPRDTLDNSNNQAQNFVVYSVSAAAADSLRVAGGFEPFNERARELWELSLQLDLHSRRTYERILFERDAHLRSRLAPRKRRIVEQMDAILADPFFQGFEVYVHPSGVKPVAFHFARMLDLNPRTPFRIELALHNLHTTVYERWLEEQARDCKG